MYVPLKAGPGRLAGDHGRGQRYGVKGRAPTGSAGSDGEVSDRHGERKAV